MANARVVISKVVTNGPFMYEFFNGANGMDKAEVSVASVGAAIDLVKPLISALPGSISRISITITTT